MKLQEIKTRLVQSLTKRNVALGIAALGVFALGLFAAKVGEHRGHDRHWSDHGRSGIMRNVMFDRGGRGMHKGDPEKRITHRVERMTKVLGLSEAQANQVTQILKDNATQMKAQFEARKQMMKADSVRRKPTEAEMQQFKAQRDALEQKIASVLTADQRTKYEKMKSERKEGMGRPHRRGGRSQG